MFKKSLIAVACSGAFLISVTTVDAATESAGFDAQLKPSTPVAMSYVMQEQRETKSQKININQASAEELASALRGVGKARAEAIIKLREELGQFTDVEQLLQVRGLGVKVLNENRDKITL